MTFLAFELVFQVLRTGIECILHLLTNFNFSIARREVMCSSRFVIFVFTVERVLRMFPDNVTCTPNPCQNGGRCQESVNTILCACPAATSGERCSSRRKSSCFVSLVACCL